MSFLSRASPPTLFPSFLLPSLPFRRSRKSSTDSTSSTASSTSSASSNNTGGPSSYLSTPASYLRCSRCAIDLCLTSAIVSRGFTGRWGRAYLVSAADISGSSSTHPSSRRARPESSIPTLPNTHTHKAVPRTLVTGHHTVSDVSCAFCGSVLGWKYVAADEESQQYKVGKFILETMRVSVEAEWEGAAAGSRGLAADAVGVDEDEGAFDSQDEDECEELFAGTWTREGAKARRKARGWR